MSKLCIGDKVVVIEKPDRREYYFEIGEILTLKNITTSMGISYGYFKETHKVIQLKRVKRLVLKNIIGGKIL